MWKPNSDVAEESRKDVSVSEKQNNLTQSGSDKVQETLVGGGGFDKEQESQSCDIDSGFLSGPQLSGYDDSEFGAEEDSSVDSKPSAIQRQTTIVAKEEAATRSILDSGCLEADIDTAEINSNDFLAEQKEQQVKQSTTTATSPKPMILDSGIDLGLTEWFCNLSLKNSNQPLNNLGGSGSDASTGSGAKNKQQDVNIPDGGGSRNKQPWEIYYCQNDDGDTQLHMACITGYAQVVAALIRLAPHPCLLNIQNDDAQTALHLAVMTGQRNIVRMLLIAGAEATMRDRNGNTPLHLACLSGNLDCVKALTIPISGNEIQENKNLFTKNDKSTYRRCAQLPPDLEQRNYDGERCVHLAAQSNHIDVLRHLVWFGADINAREGRSGKTPLHIAIEMCNEVLANFLLEECEKINLETETYAGLTAYQLATLTQNEQLAVGLEQRGAEPLTPPESDIESDDDSDSQLYDRFGDPGYFIPYNGAKVINVA